MIKMKRTKIIPARWIDEHHDSDWDGVPNFRDCQPFNPRKQEDDNKKEKTTVNESKRTSLPGYQYAQPTPAPVPGYQYAQPGYQYAQQFQIPSRMYDESIINLPAARFKFIRYIL